MRKLDKRLCSQCNLFYQPRTNQIYCSNVCKWKSRIGKKHTLETKRLLSEQRKGNKYCVGRKLADSTKELIRQANLGEKNHNFGKKFSFEIRKKISNSHKKLVEIGTHHLWKGGASEQNDIVRRSLEYRFWRKKVFERDNWTCRFCGIRSGNGKHVELQADHIKPFALFPELRFVLENGRTLCVSCHQKTDTHGFNKRYVRN